MGAAPSLSICVFAGNALSQIWLLRFFIHVPHHWKPHGSRPILCFPAKAMRVTSAVIAIFLIIDMISGASNPFEEGWVGIASVWAAIITLWCTLTDRIVAWGKREEEERLTGRPETRRTLKEWFAVLAATMISIFFIIIVILMTGTLGIRARDASLKTYGERIFVD